MIKANDKSKLQAYEIKFLRSKVCGRKRVEARKELSKEQQEEQPVLHRIEKSILKWCGHMKRTERSRMRRTVHEMVIEDKRPRGKQAQKNKGCGRECEEERRRLE